MIQLNQTELKQLGEVENLLWELTSELVRNELVHNSNVKDPLVRELGNIHAHLYQFRRKVDLEYNASLESMEQKLKTLKEAI